MAEWPTLVRPVPRRPFGFSLTSATPPELELDTSFLDNNNNRAVAAASYGSSSSHEQSESDLTSSTLLGIYSPTTGIGRRRSSGPFFLEEEDDADCEDGFDEEDHYNAYMSKDDTERDTGARAQTPVSRSPLDDVNDGLLRWQSQLEQQRRRSSIAERQVTTAVEEHVDAAPLSPRALAPKPTTETATSFALRGSLLFALGVGYGVVVSQFQDYGRIQSVAEEQWGLLMGETAGSRNMAGGDAPARQSGWAFLCLWGLAGVFLGVLLPWLDGLLRADDVDGEDSQASSMLEVRAESQTDWALVLRSIGAFVGIVFAIRKLPWASNLQLSVALALVNPLLWWLIDRSKVGLVLSGGVGLAGSAMLLGIDPSMMPAPMSTSMLGQGGSSQYGQNATMGYHDDAVLLLPGGLSASQETVVAGLWMLSVLFCSCICFGNIGRRLASGNAAVGKGRWGVKR